MKEAFQEWLTLMKRKSDKKSTGAVLIVLLKKFHVERQPGSPLRGLAMCKTHWRSILAGIAVFLICTAAAGYKYMAHERYQKMHAMPLGLLPFDVLAPVPICGRWKEHMPRVRDSEVYRRYIAARNQWRSKIEWQFTKDELTKILAEVRAASDEGDWGARALLAHFYLHGLGPLPSNRVLEVDEDKGVAIARTAVDAGQPWGYYDVGVAHGYGYGGAYYDQTIAWAYFLKAAQLGSPEAQMALAEAYTKAKRMDAAEQMVKCAYLQGHGPAAYDMALEAEIREKFQDALRLYQDGVKFGDKLSAASLFLLFDPSRGAGRIEFLEPIGWTTDQERYRRYEEISQALDLNPDLKFGHIDKAVPLPPAELPKWHGIADALDPEAVGPPTY